MEAGGLEIQDSPCLHSEFQVRLDYVRPCHKTKQDLKNQEKLVLCRMDGRGTHKVESWEILL